MRNRQIHRKGSNKSGGGGIRGGGGKKGRPDFGWEKADFSRGMDNSDGTEFPVKPGRNKRKSRTKIVRAMRFGETKGNELALRILIRSEEGADSKKRLREYAAQTIHQKLFNFARKLKWITLRVTDISGPRGGRDQECQMRAVYRTGVLAIVNETAILPELAIDRALNRIVSTIRSRKKEK